MNTKKIIRTIVIISALALLLALGTCAAFADDSETLSMELKGAGDESGVTVQSQIVDGLRYFLLPSGITEENMVKSFGDDEVYDVAQSSGVASLFFVSKDPEKKGMDYINGSVDHSAKAKGTVYLYDENFKLLYSGAVDSLKGRGNTTWAWSEKKPYQIKLEKKADLLEPKDGTQKAKKWQLLSNPFDPTLIKNTMVYNFAKEIGLECSPEGRAVDFYYDGIYRGSYYICEKVEAGEGRVEIDDMDDAVEEANPDVDLDELETAMGENSFGNEFRYIQDVKDPEDITGGYLLEVDNVYYKDELGWFSLGGKRHWTSKQPEYISENMMKYISDFCQKIYNYIHTQRMDGKKGKDIFNYIDEESFTKYFLTQEWFDNQDVWASSTYLYKPSGEDKLYAGPVWDCDSIMEISKSPEEKEPTGWKARGVGMELLELPTFRASLQKTYLEEVRPVIYDILLGEKDGKYLKTFEHMKEEIAASLAMNDMIWEYNDVDGTYYLEDTAKENYDSLLSIMKERAEWFDKAITAKSFTKIKYTVPKVKKPFLKAFHKAKSIRVTIPRTSYTVKNLVNTRKKKADNYEIAYRVQGAKKWKTIKTKGKRVFVIKKLKAGKIYQVKVRAIAKTPFGTKVGKWSNVKTVKIKVLRKTKK